MKRNKNNAGFTLLEVLIALTIVAVVGVVLTGVFGQQFDLYHKVTDRTSERANCDTVFNLVEKQVRYAKKVETDADGALVVTAEDNTVSTIAPDAYTEEYDVALEFSAGGNTVTVTANAGAQTSTDDAGNETVTYQYTVSRTIRARNAS